ncbi:MAG: hypothetical protein ABIR18_04865 [Chitinophagaceae bacterium]
MQFYIRIYNDRKYIRLAVERILLTNEIEKYRVSGKNGSFVLQSNGPLFRNKGLKHRRPSWKITEGGEIRNKAVLQKIIEAISEKESE